MEAFDGQGKWIVGLSISLTVLATGLVCTRLGAVYKRRGWFGLEEVMVISSNIFLIIVTVISCEAVRFGFGLHSKDIPAAGGDKKEALKNFFFIQIFYKIVILCNKMAFLLLYLRVFQMPSFRTVCHVSIAFVLVGSLSFIITTSVECLPVAYNWNRHIPGGHCINNSAFRWSWAAFNTATDLWVSFLPLPVIRKLQMTRAKKIGLSILFILGLFVCVTSAIRMKTLVQSTRAGVDTTWDSAPAFLWTNVEASVGLICTCLPSLRWLLSHVLPFLSSPESRMGKSLTARSRSYKMSKMSRIESQDLNLPGLVPSQFEKQGMGRIVEARAGTANPFGDSASEERIVAGKIQVETCVSVRSSASSNLGGGGGGRR